MTDPILWLTPPDAPHSPLQLAALWTARLFSALAMASLAYTLLAWLASARYRLQRRRQLAVAPRFAPPVSILKPLKGADPALQEALRSHCRQAYPGGFELLCGIASPDDPAAAIVAALQQEFPHLPIHLILCPERLGPSGKVSTLVQLARHARHPHLLVSDGDILVPPGYLARVLDGFADPAVGLVTALYRGRPGASLSSRLESMTISTDFQPGVLTALLLERGLHFALGSTLAVSRTALDAIGGFDVLLPLLADDYELGVRIHRAGYRLLLAPVVVETSVPSYRWPAFVSHQLRWLRTVRDSRRWGYLGLLFTHPLPLALLALLASGGSFWGLWLLLLALLLRLSLALQTGLAVLADRSLLADLWLLPLRDLVAFALWIASFASNRIEWRGHHFLLHNGTLIPLD